MPRGRRNSIHELHTSSRSVTPEPTTESGVTPGNALYDSPPPGQQPNELGPRNRKESWKVREYYGPSRRRSRSRSVTWTRTHERNLRAKQQGAGVTATNDPPANNPPAPANDPPAPANDPPAPPDDPPAAGDNTKRTHSKCRSKARITDPKTQPVKPVGKRPGTTRRPLSRSPSPGSTDCELGGLEGIPVVMGKTPAGSQYTYIYETVEPHVFMQYARNRLGPHADLEGTSTPTIVEMLRVKEADEATKVGSARNGTSIIMLSPEPVAVGGGWHRDRVSAAPTLAASSTSGGSRATKCGSDETGPTNSRSSKRLRATPAPASAPAPAPAENTDTEPESDDFVVVPPSPTPARPAQPSAPHVASSQAPRNPSFPPRPKMPPLRGTQPPPPTRESTASTILDPPQPSARPLRPPGGSAPRKSNLDALPLLPRLNLPVRGPVHARLRDKLLKRVVHHLDAMVRDEESEEGEADDAEEVDTSNPLPSDDDARGSVRHCDHIKTTYQQTRRSHLPLNPQARSTAAAPLARPNSPSTTQDSILAKERARAAQERQLAHALPPYTSTGNVQPCPRPSNTGAQTRSTADAREPSGRQNRRLDPVSAACADMLAYNQDVLEGRAPSAMEEATRHNRLRAHDKMQDRSGPTLDRSPNTLVEDDEEQVAHAQALAAGTFPKPARSRRCRNQKKKPLARDSTGLSRQVLVVAKLWLFAYALQEGIYQNRATCFGWARKAHQAVWDLLLPELEYIAATDGELEVMVNYLATYRGKLKERVRPVVADVHGFQHRITSQQDIQDNLDRYNLAYPNTFHCKSYSPRQGHYESPDIPRMIGAALFHGPTSVGVQFPEFFEEMPLTVVAFIMAIWQFCLEEWSRGYFVAQELSAAHMLDKYEAQLAGLKDLRSIAPRRMSRLQMEWYEYSEQYCGALWLPKRAAQQDTSLRSEMRPDSPIPGCGSEPEPDYEEEEQRLMEEVEERMMREAWLASLEQAARDNDRFFEEQERLMESHPPSPNVNPLHYPPPPPVEYDEDGRLTARSKGKRRMD
ncbi:hypothetical protein FRC08_009077 [Ceratobasidium sp. 394]|nr:hypothetical protein FRC08_009077 [Ceratobasidium sp. 394]